MWKLSNAHKRHRILTHFGNHSNGAPLQRSTPLQRSSAPYQEAILHFSNWLPQPFFGTSGKSNTSLLQDTVPTKALTFLVFSRAAFHFRRCFHNCFGPLFFKLLSCSQSLGLLRQALFIINTAFSCMARGLLTQTHSSSTFNTRMYEKMHFAK